MIAERRLDLGLQLFGSLPAIGHRHGGTKATILAASAFGGQLAIDLPVFLFLFFTSRLGPVAFAARAITSGRLTPRGHGLGLCRRRRGRLFCRCPLARRLPATGA